MLRSWMCSVAASFQARMTSSAMISICRRLKRCDVSPTSHMQIIVGFIVLTTSLIVSERRRRLEDSVLCIMASFQSILTNTMLADISVTCLCSVAAGTWWCKVRLCSVAAVRLPSDDMAKSLHEMSVKNGYGLIFDDDDDEQDKDDSSDGKEDGSAS